jgi:hypothetical protein
MDDQPRPAVVAALVEAIDRRSHNQTDWIVRSLVSGAWPGGHEDRNDPTAAQWVRRWGPSPTHWSFMSDCACSHGRCTVCN